MLQKTSLIFFTCIILTACSSTRNNQPVLQEANNPATHTFEIFFGQQGGFTGGYSGYHLDLSGKVSQISHLPGQVSTEKPLGVLSKEQIDAIRQFVGNSRFFDKISDKRGNMTYTIRIKDGDSEHIAHWPLNTNETDPQLLDLKRILMDAVSGLEH